MSLLTLSQERIWKFNWLIMLQDVAYLFNSNKNQMLEKRVFLTYVDFIYTSEANIILVNKINK